MRSRYLRFRIDPKAAYHKTVESLRSPVEPQDNHLLQPRKSLDPILPTAEMALLLALSASFFVWGESDTLPWILQRHQPEESPNGRSPHQIGQPPPSMGQSRYEMGAWASWRSYPLNSLLEQPARILEDRCSHCNIVHIYRAYGLICKYARWGKIQLNDIHFQVHSWSHYAQVVLCTTSTTGTMTLPCGLTTFEIWLWTLTRNTSRHPGSSRGGQSVDDSCQRSRFNKFQG